VDDDRLVEDHGSRAFVVTPDAPRLRVGDRATATSRSVTGPGANTIDRTRISRQPLAHGGTDAEIRARKAKTGEAYSTAHRHVMNEREALRAPKLPTGPVRLEAVVLKVNKQSARVRILGEEGEVTFRSVDALDVVPGHVVTLVVDKRWPWLGNAHASGQIESARIDVSKLGLEPLPLKGGELEDIRSAYEGYRSPDPYAPMWKKLTAKPRAWHEMDPIAWGVLPGCGPDDNPTCDAAELSAEGDVEGARELLMDVLATDLRCIDAHAHLGNLEFDRAPHLAVAHYEIGIRIGELSLPAGFDGLLVWGRLYNRPFLRCLHGYGLCLWRLGRHAEAELVFERILSLNPNDNQGVRSCWDDVRKGRRWEAMKDREDGFQAARRRRH
jgi:hypothetical protein